MLTEKELALLREAKQELETVVRIEDLSLHSIRRVRNVQDFLQRLVALHTPLKKTSDTKGKQP